MIYFQSKYLAQKLGINLAKWKRWAREFLPPDPLGGLQSGYARQFNLKAALRVFLGGYLVGVLKFSIPEARQILSDLDHWLAAQGFYVLHPCEVNHRVKAFPHYRIDIVALSESKPSFGYRIRGTVAYTCIKSTDLHQEQYTHTVIALPSDRAKTNAVMGGRTLNINALYGFFLEKITPG